ncbi:MAG: hypothetical protein PVI33_03115 [Candidatus Omnitrophota bacterium]|jgi:hypothetical protein
MKYCLIIIILLLICAYFIFYSPPETPEENPTLKLMGTSWKETGAIAVINGKLLKENEVINGYRVIKIEKGSVTLSRNNQEFKLTFAGVFRSTAIDKVRNWWQRIPW